MKVILYLCNNSLSNTVIEAVNKQKHLQRYVVTHSNANVTLMSKNKTFVINIKKVTKLQCEVCGWVGRKCYWSKWFNVFFVCVVVKL